MEFSVYIMTNISRKPLYVGVTNNLQRRIYEHRNRLCEGFTKKYKMTQRVYYEVYQYVWDAIAREKSLKLWKREWKLQLVETVNPEWEDLGNLICR